LFKYIKKNFSVPKKKFGFELDSNANLVLQKLITLQNTGNTKTIIYDISFGHSKCSGQGFSVSLCTGIELEPNEKYDLKIL